MVMDGSILTTQRFVFVFPATQQNDDVIRGRANLFVNRRERGRFAFRGRDDLASRAHNQQNIPAGRNVRCRKEKKRSK